MNCILSASTKSTQPFKTFVFLFFFPATGNKICNVIKNTLLKLLKLIACVQLRMKKLEKLCLLLISENASSPPGQKLVVGKNPILPLFDIANTPFASKHPQVIWRGIITRGKERICLQGHHFYRTTWTLCAK